MSAPAALKASQKAFAAHGAVRKLWSCRDEEILVQGPAGTGKTRGILEKAHFVAMKYPGCRILLVRKTRESMTESVLVTFEEKVVAEGSPILNGPKRNLRAAYHYPNGSEVVCGGMDKYMRIMSTEYDIICVFEGTELTEEEFEALTTRLRNGVVPYQQIIVDCNPAGPNHWLNKRPERSGMTRLVSRHEDNPVYFDHKTEKWTEFGESYRKKLMRLTGARRLRLFEGKWAASEGMVYTDWNPEIQLIDNFKIPESWRKLRVIDFGFRNPFVCQWWALDEDDRMYLYREIYMPGRIVSEHAKVINEKSKGETYIATVADHDAEDRASLDAVGIFTKPAYKDVTRGIEAVQARMKMQGDSRPRIFIMRGCLVERSEELAESALPVCTSDEIEGYIWMKDKEGQNKKEEPVKKDDHGMDAMRYAVAEVDDLHAMMLTVTGDTVSIVR